MSSDYGFYGGTFDPVHRGHLAVAAAALADQRFSLKRIYFIPASLPPHKQGQPITSYDDRFAMLELALQGASERRLIASKLESPDKGSDPNYSIHSVRRLKEILRQEVKDPELYFIVGVDSFLQIGSWRQPEALLNECKFIVVSRPGFAITEAVSALPRDLSHAASGRVFLLPTVAEDVSSSQIRTALANGQPLGSFVPESVAKYIQQHGLYR